MVGAVASLVAIDGTAEAHTRHHSSSNLSLNAPTGIAVSGSDLFVANGGGNTVTEVNAANGSRVATISAKHFAFNGPTAILSVAGDLFVANGRGNSVTEIRAAGRKHVRTIKGARFGFNDPVALASSGSDLFVLNGGGSVTEVTTSGGFVGIVSGAAYGFHKPTGLAVAAGRVFVANSTANSVTVFNATTRALAAVLANVSYGFSTPIGVAFDGHDVWVSNQGGESVTELSPTTLQELNVLVSGNLPMVGPITYGDGYVFTVSPPGSSPMVTQIVPSPANVTWMMCNTNGPYLFNNPQSLVVDGSNLWVANKGGNSLTEMNSDSGALIRTVA
jgi:YVTN family beta-propeller protein